MRCFVALQTGLALLLAFDVAPFEHVHTGHDDHPGLIHSHFYHLSPVAHSLDVQGGPQLVDSDDDHATARSLDTFTLDLAGGLASFIPTRGPVLLFAPSETFAPVEAVEERGHDPPPLDRSIPRAPPA